LADPRGQCNALKHDLIEILVISLCSTLCGAESFMDMEIFGRSKESWLRERLGLRLTHGIPSHDTFNRLFARLSTEAFGECFRNWTRSLQKLTDGQVIALDGKTLRRAFDSASGRGALQVVSAWASKNRLSLGQVIVDSKSNEITAVPALLKLLDIRGCIITVDALNSQKEIAAQILEQGADYVFALKKNHPLFYDEVVDHFRWARQCKELWSTEKYEAAGHILFSSEAQTKEFGHGRREERRAWAIEITQKDWPKIAERWPGIKSIVLVESVRSIQANDPEHGPQWQANEIEQRYFLSSLPADASSLMHAVRDHWGIENSLHWVLDVAFNEDDSRIRKDNAASNMAILRQLALNLIRNGPTRKGGVKARRRTAGWDNEYLLELLCTDKS